jgi:hypothetical protein
MLRYAWMGETRNAHTSVETFIEKRTESEYEE